MAGLLKRAQGFLDNIPTFDEWATKNGLNNVGILKMHAPKSAAEEMSDGYYFFAESKGFNVKTIASSLSAKKFWDKTLSKAFEWQCFSKDFNELTPFYDLFDEDLRTSLDSLYFLPFNNKNCPMYLVVAEFESDDEINLPKASETAAVLKKIADLKDDEEKRFLEIEKSIERGLEISNAHLLILSLKSCVEKTVQNTAIWRKMTKIDTVDKIEMRAQILFSVASAAKTILSPLFCSPNCFHVSKNGEMKIVMFSKDDIDEETISFHLATTLSSLIGNDAEKQILLLSAGICQNKKGTLAFLKQG